MPPRKEWTIWRDLWCSQQKELTRIFPEEVEGIPSRLIRWNLQTTPTRYEIEKIWEAIDQNNDWIPLHEWLNETSID